MKKLELIQQGDVLFFRVDKIEKTGETIKPKNGRIVVAEGEHTGHAHAISAINDVAAVMIGGQMALDVKAKITVRHEEHNPVTLRPGNYVVDFVKEVDPFSEEVRRVAD